MHYSIGNSGDINEETRTAKYLGVTNWFELHYNTVRHWLFLKVHREYSEHRCLIIGHDAAVGQANDISQPLRQDDPWPYSGETVQMYLYPDGKYYGTIYFTPKFGGSMYIDWYSWWPAIVKDWTSTNEYLIISEGQWIWATEKTKESNILSFIIERRIL